MDNTVGHPLLPDKYGTNVKTRVLGRGNKKGYIKDTHYYGNADITNKGDS